MDPSSLHLVQVSDLHIGEIDPQTGDALLPGVLQWAQQRLTWLDGYLGHHAQALEDIEDFIEQTYRDAGIEPRMLVTGDLSRAGSGPSLALARDFVEAQIPLGRHRQAGLACGPVDHLVAGNHDHWADTPPPPGGAGSIAWAQLFGGRAPPQPMPDLPLPDGRRLVIWGLDSEADVAPRTWGRTMARGSFVSQVQALGQALRPRADDEVRVLLLHHSPAERGVALGIDGASRDALSALLAAHDFSAVLTGHAHVPMLVPFDVQDPATGRTRRVHELRCGSSAQIDTTPKPLLGAGAALPGWLRQRRPPNALLTHEIALQADGSLAWTSQVWTRTRPGGGFEPWRDPQGRDQAVFRV